MSVTAFIATLSLIVAIFSAVFSYQSNEQSKYTHTYVVKSEFSSKFPGGAKSCFTYISIIDQAIARDAIKGRPHYIRTEAQMDALKGCLPEIADTQLKINDRLSAVRADELKEKIRKALNALDQAAAQLGSSDTCDLAKELAAPMLWSELGSTVQSFANFGEDGNNPALFRNIINYRSQFGGSRGLADVCKN